MKEVSAQIVVQIQLPKPNLNQDNKMQQVSENKESDDDAAEEGGITSIDSALDASNSEILSPTSPRKHYTTILQNGTNTKKKALEIAWSNVQP